jgi:hypothetical protein
MRNRIVAICAAVSALIPAALLLFSVLSRDVVHGFTGGFPLARHFYVGVFDGGLWFHSHELPYRGSILGSIPPKTRGLELPRVYYRSFGFPEPIWTLRVSLVYPLVAATVFPIIWLRRVWRGRHNPAASRAEINPGRENRDDSP